MHCLDICLTPPLVCCIVSAATGCKALYGVVSVPQLAPVLFIYIYASLAAGGRVATGVRVAAGGR